MRSRLFMMFSAIGLLGLPGWFSRTAEAQELQLQPIEARVWLDRGEEPVLQRGERSRIYYRVSENAFVAIFHIDTNGNARMVFPSSPQENHYARAGRDYRVLFPGSSYWYVGDDPGIGYFFILASPEPFDFRDFGYSHFSGGWDLDQVGRQVYGDPYLAMDDYVAALIPEWEYIPYGLDFSSYHVERRHEYPRFLCYDCHGFQPYYNWNPYAYSCTSFRVVIYNDPYYYPATRYRGTRVVYVQPRRGVAQFGFKERAVGEVGTPHVVVRNTPPVTRPGVEQNGTRRAVPRSGTPSAFSPGSTGRSSPATSGTARPGIEGSSNRRTGTTGSGIGATSRPSATNRSGATGNSRTGKAGAVRSQPGTVRTDPAGSRGSGTTTRPTLQRRTTGTRSATTPPRTTQPTRTQATRPSSRVRNSGQTGGTTRSSGAAARSSGATSRSNPTVRSGGTTRSSGAAARSSGATSRSNPTVRSGGTTRSSGSAARSNGAASKRKPTVRTTTTRSKPKVRKPRGGGVDLRS